MECPTCLTQFHPKMNNALVGRNRRNNSIFLYFQLCPECEEPIVGVKEATGGEIYMNPNNLDGLISLTKERRKKLQE